MNSKKEIRKQIRENRLALSEFDRESAGQAVLEQLKTSHRYHSANRIALYLANDGELPLTSVTRHIWKRKKSCYLPAIFTYQKRKMKFSLYEKGTRFRDNRYGIPEPTLPIGQQISSMNLDLVLLPLVAFDLCGNRVGMGGGFYDQTFEFLKRRQYWMKPHLLGVAYDFQEVDVLQSDDWDIPLSGVVTPSRLIEF